MQQQVNNWDDYRRKQVNIRKSKSNQEVSNMLQKHYKYLHSRLVKFEEDEDTFNDTFLKLTYNYNPDKDFIDQFIYYFNLLKGAYFRDSKVRKYQVTSIEERYDEVAEIIDEDEPTTLISEDNFLNDLTNDMDALSKEINQTKN